MNESSSLRLPPATTGASPLFSGKPSQGTRLNVPLSYYMAQPLIEVFSVAIFPDSLPCEVYGDIFVYDADNSKQTYKLYQRHSEHPEVISKDGQVLFLTGLDVALSMPKPVISVRLMDRARDKALIVSGTDPLDNTTKDDYEEVKYSEIKGDPGHVRVTYVAMPCGAVADVWISLNDYEHDVIQKLEEIARSPEDFDEGFPVFGTYRCSLWQDL